MRAFAKTVWRAYRGLGRAGALDLGRFLAMSPRAWLEETFETPQIHATLGAWGMHLDFAPDIAGGALFPYLEAMVNQAFGMVIGKGGADVIVTAMQAEIERKGGTLRCGAEVREILQTNGQAKGVRLADGSEIAAKRAVIANVAPAALARMIGDAAPDYRTNLQKFRHAPGTMMIHLAMDELPNWKAGPALRDYAYVHLAPSLDQMAATYAQAKAGYLPDEPVIVVGQPTAIDPSRAPDGKHVLWLQVRMVPGEIKGDAAGKIHVTDWDSAKPPMTARVLNLLEDYAPGTNAKILGQDVVGPLDLQADNPNLVGGDQVCGSHHLSQHFLFRPMRGRSDGSTPIDHLWHTGAAVWPGGGTGAGPGYMLGKHLTK